MKKKRQDTILSLIAAEEIPTQEVLRERMDIQYHHALLELMEIKEKMDVHTFSNRTPW